MRFLTALLTPFDLAHRVDLRRLRAHVLWQIAQGVDGFVVTTHAGEFLYLTPEERREIHRTVLDAAPGRAVYVGAFDPSPSVARELTLAARDEGATGAIVPPPLLHALEPAALRQWYLELAREGLPMFAYHAPRRLGVKVPSDLYADLRREGILAGLLDGTEDPWRIRRMSTADPGALLVSGDRLLPRVLHEAWPVSFVSILGNAWPSFCLRLARQGETQLEEAMVDRAQRVARAGGLRALKSLLRMGARPPLPEPPDEALMGLPPVEAAR